LAKRKYKPYPTRKEKKNRRLRNLAMVIFTLIVAVVIFNRTYRNPVPEAERPQKQTVQLNDILPSKSTPPAKPKPKPITVLNPAVASAKQQPSSQQAQTPTAQPISTPEPAQLRSPEPPREAEPSVRSSQPATEPVVEETASIPDAMSDESSDRAKALVEQALKLRDAGKVIQARELLNDTLNEKLSPNLRSAVKFQLSKLADQWLFSDTVFPEDKLSGTYVVQRGDLLQNIAKKYKVPHEIIMEINGISDPKRLMAGQQIKVIEGPFNVVVYKSNYTMDLYLQNRYVKTYRVGLGKIDRETPSGRWRVQSGGKLIEPSWYDEETGRNYDAADPDYPLGSRWIEIEGIDDTTRNRTGFAIHGTKEPESIGTRSSRGCIRLANSDVIEVYKMLYGGISEVLIMD
jgi:LysM repeat protein